MAMKQIVERRKSMSFVLSTALGLYVFRACPFPEEKQLPTASNIYRNKIGFDVALRLCVIAISNAKPQWMTCGRAAKVCRVARVMQPYLESIV
jgi:hypothetical protein